MTGRVYGKVAFITGAARGQGRSHPVDMSNARLFPASNEARHITGVPLPVDAGYSIVLGASDERRSAWQGDWRAKWRS